MPTGAPVPSGPPSCAGEPHLPAAVDPVQFARASRLVQGEATLAQLPRLAQAGVLAMEPLSWCVRGERARDPLDRLREFIHVSVRFEPTLSCVRCLEPVRVGPVEGRGTLRLAASETQAVQEDRDSGDVDVIAAGSELDLAAVIEDEAILALPMVPAHENCSGPCGCGLEIGNGAAQAAGESERAERG